MLILYKKKEIIKYVIPLQKLPALYPIRLQYFNNLPVLCNFSVKLPILYKYTLKLPLIYFYYFLEINNWPYLKIICIIEGYSLIISNKYTIFLFNENSKKILFTFYPALFFRKKFNNILYYLEYEHIFLIKKEIQFFFEKNMGSIEYQINIREYLGLEHYVFLHLQDFILKKQSLFKTMKMKLYLFHAYSPEPKVKSLYFLNLDVLRSQNLNRHIKKSLYFNNIDVLKTSDLNQQIINFFNFSYSKYESICLDDFYKQEHLKNNIAIKLCFSKIPTQTQLLIIEPFTYFERKSCKEDTKYLNYIVNLRNIVNFMKNDYTGTLPLTLESIEKVLADQTFNKLEYLISEYDF